METDELGTAIPIIPLLYLLVFTWHTAGIHAQHAPLGGNLLANRGRAFHVGLGFKKNGPSRNANKDHRQWRGTTVSRNVG